MAETKNCKHCGGSIERTRQSRERWEATRYCGLRCAAHSQLARTVVCVECGNPFSTKSPTVRHCSISCRFWPRIDTSPGQGPRGDCWEWTGARHGKGYGHIQWRGIIAKAHRVAYFLAYGWLSDDRLVCHTCDNPPCCNPAHLWVGTHKQNSNDRDRKGRWKNQWLKSS